MLVAMKGRESGSIELIVSRGAAATVGRSPTWGSPGHRPAGQSERGVWNNHANERLRSLKNGSEGVGSGAEEGDQIALGTGEASPSTAANEFCQEAAETPV